jgi:hypothetical protein
MFFAWESGIPINMFATGQPDAFPVHYTFIVPRGSEGRTPSLWDVNLRIAYDWRVQRTAKSRVVLDILHAGNPQAATTVDELRYLGNSGKDFFNLNPQYRKPIAYQEPMMARLGFELSY